MSFQFSNKVQLADDDGDLLDAANPLRVSPAASEDVIFDHASGTKTSVTTSATVFTPPTGCKYVRISSDTDCFVNTSGATAIDNGTALRLIANVPEILPVTEGVAVKVLSASGTAVVRCSPFKAR